MAGLRRALVALAAALALADASIVALALPPILVELDTTITGVAAVVGVYALVLALAILPAARLDARRAGPWGLALFAAASLGCALAGSLAVLLVFRALQAAGGAVALLAAFGVLDAGESRAGRRLWLGAALVGTAAGPAIGGLLTELFDWRAIFVVQAPLAAAAAVACWPSREPAVARVGVRDERETPADDESGGGLWSHGAPEPGETARADDVARPAGEASLDDPAPFRDLAPSGAEAAAGRFEPARASGADTARILDEDVGEPDQPSPRRAPVQWGDASPRALAALAFTAAAFTSVLFLLVIELVAGFAMSPLRAALGVTILPLAALAAAAIPGSARPRALAGAILLAGGAAALAFLPAPSIAWTVVPQLLAGAGMGLALPAFAGELLPERTIGEAAVGLAARHAGIVVVLAILAPVATAKLESGTEQAILRGAALILDAQIEPLEKLELAPALLDDIDLDSPRAALADAVEARRGQFGGDLAVYDRLGKRLDDVVVVAVQDAFEAVYLIAAALALVAAALLGSAWRRTGVIIATAASLMTVAVYAFERDNRAPPPVTLENPCEARPLPEAGGVTGAIQNEALRVLDRGACRFGSSREEFALALFDRERAVEYEREHGVNPRDIGGLLSLIGG